MPVSGDKSQAGEKSNLVKPPEISLPKGGGAIRGMGEKFSANPVTGTGSMSVPIATSPGRGGFGPQLSLSYDSGTGNGPFGLGWNLSLPTITRKTDKGLPQYGDEEESDVFLISGAEDLVPVLVKQGNKWVYEPVPDSFIDAIQYKIRRYRPRIEGLFARIERWTNPQGVSHWRSISKENITTVYGHTDASRIVDPANPQHIFSWLICESYDDKGNAIRYEYKAENSLGIDRANANEANRTDSGRTANRYIKRIKYGNKTPRVAGENLSLRDDWMFETVFDYGEHYGEYTSGDVQTLHFTDNQHEWDMRKDPFSSYRAGFEVRTYRLCQRVLMFHHFDELGDPNYLVRATHFSYTPGTVATFINKVTQSAYKLIGGTYKKKSTPPVEFTYSEAIIQEQVLEVDPASLENLPQGLDNSRYQWVDLDGEGLSGILTEQAGAWFYKRNQSALPVKDNAGNETTVARFLPLERVASMPSTANLSGGQQLLDMAGNGQLDVVEFDGAAPGYFERTTDENWETHRPFTSLPNIAWQDPNLKFIDLTGDGHADILITEDEAFSWYPSLAEAGFGPGEKVRQAIDEEQGPRLVFADGTQSIYLADMSGDGLTDLVRIRNGEVCYWPNLGYARFGAKVSMDNAPWFDAPDIFDQRRIRLADIDGSGVVDILYLAANGVHLYFNQSGNAWRPRRLLSTFPRIDNLSSVSTLDLLGNGTACLVWSSPLPGEARNTIRYIDLMGGQKPHLLIKTKNNLGAETQVEYSTSTKFYLQDKQAGKPWITKLPFPVHVVTQSTITDKWRNTRFSSAYSYHHGYFDGIEREFRGFARVEQIDTESYLDFAQGNIDSPNITQDQLLYQPPIKSVTWYHTGAAFERDRILSALKQEYFKVPGFTEHPLPEPTLTPGDLTPDEWREAVRACKGMVLRQEVFELDAAAISQGIQKPVRLYTTAYHNSDIKRLQPQGINRHAVFLVTESEAISYGYELDLLLSDVKPDPRIAHTLNLRFDDYGRAQQSVAVVYPRLLPYSAVNNPLNDEQITLIHKVQAECHLVYSETHFTDELSYDPDQHRLPAPCEVLTYELTGANPIGGFIPSAAGYFTLNDFKSFNLTNAWPGHGTKPVIKLEYQQQPDNENAHMRLVEWVRMLYFKDDLTDAKSFGEYSWHGLLYETYKLALTKNLLDAVLASKLSAEVLTKLNTPTIAGYLPGTALSSTFTDQWWMRSGIAGFVDDPQNNFYLPNQYTDPFEKNTSLTYDSKYHLFIQSSQDEMGNTSGVWIEAGKPRFDYRVLAPIEMFDANGNRSEVVFDILGLVVAAAVKGKGSEADDLIGFDDERANPSVDDVQKFCTASEMKETTARDWLHHASARFVYHFGEGRDINGNFTRWAERPAGACGIVRETHKDPASELQVSLECSDGSGNVLMKKIQAEPEHEGGPLRWIINGLTVLNNKGKPVKQYEPAFSADFGCEVPQANGVTPIMYYDAAGRVVRTEMPDGTFSRVEFTPWHAKTFDANDTVKNSRWYMERLTAAERGVPLHGPNDTPQQKAEALAAEALAQAAGAEDKRAARLAAKHANTSAQVHLDSLGREVIAIAHNRTPDSNGVWQDAYYTTHTKLDAEGKPLWIRDARRNLVMQYIIPPKPTRWVNESNENMPAGSVPCYDIAGNLLFQHSMDAGDRWMLMDAAGKPMLAWDMNDKGEGTTQQQRIYHTAYDKLHRPTAQWLQIDAVPPALVEKFDYCDTASPCDATGPITLVDAHARNLIGQAVAHFDPSGKATVERIDLSGKPAHITRTLIQMVSDPELEPEILDWKPNGVQPLMEEETFIQLTEYDALGRMTTLYNWHRDITFAAYGTQTVTAGTTNRVAVYVPEYNERGALKAEWLHVHATKNTVSEKISFTQSATPAHNTKAIQEITYNAKGQKEQLKLRNGTTTTFTYDDQTSRLTNLRTVRTTPPTGLQNLHYTYDPVGNITHINDAAQEAVFRNNSVIRPEHHYVYDALYRLIEGTGRENPSTPAPPKSIEGHWPHGPIPTPDEPRNYTQRYVYDAVGNFLEMRHGSTAGTRYYKPADDSNRLLRTWYGDPDWNATTASDKTDYRYDYHGNMLNLNNVAPPPSDPEDDWGRYLQWDWRDMIRGFDSIGGGIARYHYGIDKQRTRKYITRNPTAGGTITEDRIYLGGYELYRRRNPQGVVVEEIESLHLFEGEQRVLLVDDVITSSKGTPHPRPDGLTVKPQTLFRYQYSNHLGSASLELDEQAEIISYEEYHPYGTSAYRLMKSGIEAPAKRYRYTGMERDEESGLGYHTARYYMPWLGRWASCDPIGISDGPNIFMYGSNSPITLVDKDGTQAMPATASQLAIIEEFKKQLLPEMRFEKQIEDDTPVIGTLPNGQGWMSTRSGFERDVARIKRQMAADRFARTLGNIAGGPAGAIGYLANGENGSDIGAVVDSGSLMFSPNPVNSQSVVGGPDASSNVRGAPTYQQESKSTLKPRAEATPQRRETDSIPVRDKEVGYATNKAVLRSGGRSAGAASSSSLKLEAGGVAVLNIVIRVKNAKPLPNAKDVISQIKRWEGAVNPVIKKDGMEGLQNIVLESQHFRKKINETSAAILKTFGVAGEDQAWLHDADSVILGNPTLVSERGDSRVNSIMGANNRRIAKEILLLPTDTKEIRLKVVLLLPPTNK